MRNQLVSYRRNQIDGAKPAQILVLLFQTAVQRARTAILCCEQSKDKERGDAVRRLLDIVIELRSTLDRSVGDIATNLNYPELVGDARQVLETLVPRECEVRSRDGAWYAVCIQPYRTLENVIDGVVITFIDISEQKQVQEELRQANLYARAVVDTVREPLVVLDGDLRVQSANQSFYDFFQVTAQQTEGQLVHELGDQPWDIAELRELLERILREDAVFNDFEVECEFSTIGKRKMLLNARRIPGEGGRPPLILLAMEDTGEGC